LNGTETDVVVVLGDEHLLVLTVLTAATAAGAVLALSSLKMLVKANENDNKSILMALMQPVICDVLMSTFWVILGTITLLELAAESASDGDDSDEIEEEEACCFK
jgi:hypothetical protein